MPLLVSSGVQNFTGEWLCSEGQSCVIHEDGRLVWSTGCEARVSATNAGRDLTYYDPNEGDGAAAPAQQATLRNGRLEWNDGDVWSRSNASRLQEVATWEVRADAPAKKTLDVRLLSPEMSPERTGGRIERPFSEDAKSADKSTDLLISVVNAATAMVSKFGEELQNVRDDIEGISESLGTSEAAGDSVRVLRAEVERLRKLSEPAEIRRQMQTLSEKTDERFAAMQRAFDEDHQELKNEIRALSRGVREAGTLANPRLSEDFERRLERQVHTTTESMRLVKEHQEAFERRMQDIEASRREEPEPAGVRAAMDDLRRQLSSIDRVARDARALAEASNGDAGELRALSHKVAALERSRRVSAAGGQGAATGDLEGAFQVIDDSIATLTKKLERVEASVTHLSQVQGKPGRGGEDAQGFAWLSNGAMIEQVEETLSVQNSTLRALEDTYTETVGGLRREVQALTKMVFKLYEDLGAPAPP